MILNPSNQPSPLKKLQLVGPSALVVSGDGRFADALARYLESDGWQTRVASNERDAAASCSTHRPDVIVVELEGHEVDGFELLAAIRAPELGIPSVLLARCIGSDGIDPRILRALGIVAVVRQPCRFGLLAGTLDSIVTPPRAVLPGAELPDETGVEIEMEEDAA